MNLPFTSEQFSDIFSLYNTGVWPAQILIYLLAAVAFILLFKRLKYSDKIISLILALFWLWMGVAYHWLYFSSINPAAKFFGGLFVLQGILLLYSGVLTNKISFNFKLSWNTSLGIGLMVLGAIIYPILSYNFGHVYPYSPTFGLPCPTTIFTFGVLLMSSKLPKYLAIIPFIWSVIGFTAAFSLGVKEDVLLLIAGLIGFSILLLRPGTNLLKK